MKISIRAAEGRDVDAIGRVHVASWHETYRGFVPDCVLAGIDAGERARHWGSLLAAADCRLFVAEVEGSVVGFGACGPTRDPLLHAKGEIFAIYVLKRWQYRGIGTRLVGAMASWLGRCGPSSLGLWVGRDNLAAVAFGRAIGGELRAKRDRESVIYARSELALVWDDVTDLAFWDEPAGTLLTPARKRPARDVQWRSAVVRTIVPGVCPPA